jgi:hypothetical protein
MAVKVFVRNDNRAKHSTKHIKKHNTKDTINKLTGKLMTPRNEHITPVLKALHWLPFEFRLTFKILLLMTYKILHDLSLSYMSSLLHARCSIRSLRSSSRSLMSIPSVKTYGQRAFSYCSAFMECSPRICQAFSFLLRD